MKSRPKICSRERSSSCQYTIETDFHPFVKGITFDQVWANKVAGRIEGIPVCFASLDDLIKVKKAAGRSRDKEDLKVLRKLKKKEN